MKVTVDKDLCIGCGLCENICPEVFELKDNIAVVKTDVISPENEKTVKQAANDCPTEAIKIQ